MNLTRAIYENLPGSATTLIETGSYLGDSIAQVIHDADLSRIASVECDYAMYLHCVKRFAKYPHVQIAYGLSPIILPLIMDGSQDTIFWLDAHFTGTKQDGLDSQFGECPLIAELDAITAVAWNNRPVILIDDSFMFTGRFWAEHDDCHKFSREQWPGLDELKGVLRDYEVIENGDILVATPKELT